MVLGCMAFLSGSIKSNNNVLPEDTGPTMDGAEFSVVELNTELHQGARVCILDLCLLGGLSALVPVGKRMT